MEEAIGHSPAISVIVPAYNAADTIRAAISSVLAQTFRDFELIVVDDGSTDTTPDILRHVKASDRRIRVFGKENGGVSSARNLGLTAACGTWIAFLDADDRMNPDYLKELMSAVQSDVDMVIAGATAERDGKRVVLENQGGGVLYKAGIRGLQMQILDESSHGGNPCCIYILGCICSKLFKRSLLHNIKFDERIGMREDAVFNLEALSHARRVAISKSCGYLYRSEGESASVKFHPNFDGEVDAFLGDCMEVWERDGLPEESFHRGVLYTYMSWLKLYALHPSSGFDKACSNGLITGSFSDPRWRGSFVALSRSRLDVPYALLRFAYLRKSVCLVRTLKWANDVKKRLS